MEHDSLDTQGFCGPYLNYTTQTLQLLVNVDFHKHLIFHHKLNSCQFQQLQTWHCICYIEACDVSVSSLDLQITNYIFTI